MSIQPPQEKRSLASRARVAITHIFERPKPPPELDDGQPANDPFAGNFQWSQPFEITINGIQYPCTEWRTIEEARPLQRAYDAGYVGGMGVFAESAASAPDQFYISMKMDTTTYPYIRLPKYVVAKIDVAAMSGANPIYGFTEEDSGGTEYFYLISGSKIAKIKLSDNTLANAIRDADIDSAGGTAVIGRPVLFNGKHYVPCGNLHDWIRLATVATGSSADTWETATTLSVAAGDQRATHFALHMQEGVAQIVKAFNNETDANPSAGVESRLFSLSADGIAYGDAFHVGDSSLGITDMLSIAGELFFAKPDSPWRVSTDGGGNGYAVMDFVGKAQKLSAYTGEDGANSGSWGNFAYFTHSSGIWRVSGDAATPIDPGADPRWVGIALDSVVGSVIERWGSVATYGRWLYAASGTRLFYGYIVDDGSVRWAGVMFDNDSAIRALIAPNSTNPILWILDSLNDLHRIDLDENGSTKEINVSGKRGAYGNSASPTVATAQLWMPETAFGKPEVLKQLRMGWMYLDDYEDDGVTASIRVHRDRAVTATAVGAGYASGSGQGGHVEVSMMPGTDDTFHRLIPAFRFATGAGYAPATSDPRCREWGLRAVTPHVYRVTIPLNRREMRGYNHQIRDSLSNLRDLKSGASIAIREPRFNATFTGYIVDVQEQSLVQNDGFLEHAIVLTVRRWIL